MLVGVQYISCKGMIAIGTVMIYTGRRKVALIFHLVLGAPFDVLLWRKTMKHGTSASCPETQTGSVHTAMQILYRWSSHPSVMQA